MADQRKNQEAVRPTAAPHSNLPPLQLVTTADLRRVEALARVRRT
jgi:hypothetical protein